MLGLSLTFGSTAAVLTDILPALAVTSNPVGAPTASAVTVNWADGITLDGSTIPRDVSDPNYTNFQHISFSVNQTENLTHQGISVEWSGAQPTSSTQYSQNFMQVMQCWSDDPRSCQFGQPSQTIANSTGFQVQSRSISPGVTGLDPNFPSADLSDDLVVSELEDGTRTYAYPFLSRSDFENGNPGTFEVGQLFSSATTNEVGAVPTASDGTGMLNFEVQTTLEAPHLGCGADDGYGTSYPCYLVIVPRGTLDLNGQPAADSAGHINGSPLSYSAWKNRVVIPLYFSPVGASCPLGQDEVRIVGSDIVQKAITSWQPALCQQGTTYGFSRIGDDEARAQISSTGLGSSHMAIVSDSLKETDPHAPGIDYAPITQSAIVVAYNIDYSLYDTSPLFSQKNGTKVHNLKLNQRLVAKLLTQSYREDTPGSGFGNDVVLGNPRTITVDPEFLELNPEFADFTRVAPKGLLVPFGNSDANKHVWEWVRSNADAKAFLEGSADPWGMKVNPSYQALGITEGEAPVSFPKADLHTYSAVESIPPYGTLEMRPYYTSLDETGMRALRADANVKTAWDPFKLPAPGQYVALAPQPVGQRFMLALTDLATAYRYGLDVAELQTGVEGNFVAPTQASVQSAVQNRTQTKFGGVTRTDWTKPVADAYPLSEVSFAAVSICTATEAERTAYVSLLDWVSDPSGGQVAGDELGQLPRGYFPLTTAQRDDVTAALSDISNPADKAARCALPTKAKKIKTVPTKTTKTTSASVVESSPSPTGTAMFIRQPYYGEGVTKSHAPDFSKMLMAGGYIAGIPMVITGLLMQRRYGNRNTRV